MTMEIASPKKAKKFFEAKTNFTTGPAELNQMLKRRENINIVDVRAPDDYTKGHIPGAINLPKERWEAHTGLNKEKTNVVYCYSEECHLAANAAKDFADKGFPVMELEGGIESWKKYDMPIEE